MAVTAEGVVAVLEQRDLLTLNRLRSAARALFSRPPMVSAFGISISQM